MSAGSLFVLEHTRPGEKDVLSLAIVAGIFGALICWFLLIVGGAVAELSSPATEEERWLRAGVFAMVCGILLMLASPFLHFVPKSGCG